MSFVVLAPGASALACSIVHSHQDSFGHELELLGAGRGGPGGVLVACACGWSGVLPQSDVLTDDRGAAASAVHRLVSA